MVVKPGNDDYEEVSTDLLSMRGHERYRPKDYHMDYLAEDKHYFIVSPKGKIFLQFQVLDTLYFTCLDVVLGKSRDADDRLDWLLEHEKFSDALDLAEATDRRLLRRHSVVEVGKR